MTVEQRLEQLERKTNRLRIAVVVLAAALCGVVSMAATETGISNFDTVIAKSIVAKSIYVRNAEGNLAAGMGSDDGGDGLVTILSSTGNSLVTLTSTDDGSGSVSIFGPTDNMLVKLGATSNGGVIAALNKAGEANVTLNADDYGNGEVGVWNRKGKGRVYTSQ